MSANDLTLSFVVDETPETVFNAINRVSDWWAGEISGASSKLGDEFTYRYQDMHVSKQKVTEFVPGKKVVWKVLESNLSFLTDHSEWTNTEIVFDLKQVGDKTELRFTHKGLTPGVECYEACSSAWSSLVGQSLRNLVTTGTGMPDMKL